MDVHERVGQRLLFAFKGMEELPDEAVNAIEKFRPAGFTLFRSFNISSPEQVKRLITKLQNKAAALGMPPFLIGVDQEGGQLMAVGDGTQLPGNMALGAAGDPELAFKAGRVIGREMAALGVNVVYAPCADVNINPANPVVGTRSFGDDPQLVSRMTAALVRGIQSCGVAATVKHFPGHGDTSADSHHKLSTLPHSLERLRTVELPPFVAAIQADVRMVMTAHLGIESIDGPNSPPATLSKKVVGGLLRTDLGFKGVVVTDAMDMRAILQGDALRGEVVKAAAAGDDLVMITSDPADQERAFEGLSDACRSGEIPQAEFDISLARVAALKSWLKENYIQPPLDVIRCGEHKQVAQEIAERSVTLVQNTSGLLPLNLAADQKIAMIVPMPQDLTPADTSFYVKPALADALRRFHPHVEEIFVGLNPSGEEIHAVLQKVNGCALAVAGTINAYTQPGQQELVNRLIQAGIRTVVVAMRLPYDAALFPQAAAILCTYSILEPSMQAAAALIFGKIPAVGKLPVKLPDIL